MKESNQRLEATGLRLHKRVFVYEFILYILWIASLYPYYIGKLWAGTSILGISLILAIVYFLRGFRPSEDKNLLLYQKFTGLAQAMAILGLASRILYMQSDILFLGISGFIILSLIVIHFVDVKKQKHVITLELQDLIRLSILLMLTILLMIWRPPLPQLLYSEMIQ